jgi:ribosomal protein S19
MNIYDLITNYASKYVHILPVLVGRKFRVHNGRVLSSVLITNKMLGNTIGEYVHTKKRCIYKRRKSKKKR